MRWWVFLAAWQLWAAAPSIKKVMPIGGQLGTTVDVEITGANLAAVKTAEFDARDLDWTTVAATSTKVTGRIRIGATAALGPHWMRLHSAHGLSDTVFFNVGQFPAVREVEPNDSRATAHRLSGFPIEIYGEMLTRDETDYYMFHAAAGELWSFDLRSTEIGSNLECKMNLWDASGNRLAFNDDRSEFDDTPFISYRFERDGDYYIQVDQYHGPRAADSKNDTYILRLSQLPEVRYVSKLGVTIGKQARIRMSGARLDSVDRVYLSEVRLAEYFRLTYPHTIPVQVRPDPETGNRVRRIEGRLLSKSADSLETEFTIPADARSGLYRLWVNGKHGMADSVSIDVSNDVAIDGVIARPQTKNEHVLQGVAGKPLHIYTLSQQLGMPTLDTVLQVRDASGKLVAENDDLVSGAASLGTPDSSAYFTPKSDGPLTVTVFDRLHRGGSAFAYLLKVDSARPSFQMWTLPDNLAIERGGKGKMILRMVREQGYEKAAVSVWAEGLPEGITASRARFREDQAWELGSDGLQMTTPEVELELAVAPGVAPGIYPIRVLGRGDEDPERRVVAAHANLFRGPLTNLFNFVRRPLPAITITVVEGGEKK